MTVHYLIFIFSFIYVLYKRKCKDFFTINIVIKNLHSSYKFPIMICYQDETQTDK